MVRILPLVALVAAVFAPFAIGKRAPSQAPAVSAATASIVVTGTAAEIDKKTVSVPSTPGGADHAEYTLAPVKITESIRGLNDVKEIKVGFVANPRSGGSLVAKQDYLLFLTKHPVGDFYTVNWNSPAVPLTADTKTVVASVQAVGKILADPEKALAAEKDAEKADAALVLIAHYRLSQSGTGVERTTEAVPLEVSQSILKALAAADWGQQPTMPGYNFLQSFYSLGLDDKSGWKPMPPKPGEDGTAAMRQQFTEWLKADGAKYQIQKFAPKK